MMICGLSNSSAFFSFLAVLLTIQGSNSFTVIRSTTWNGHGDVDRFSNPSCNLFHCGNAFGSICSTADCCLCQCLYSQPNYVISAGRCRPSDGIDEGCQFMAALNDDAPLTVNEMTKTGTLQFQTPGICNSGMQVTKWHYRLTGHAWIPGSPNVFKVATVAGEAQSWILQWNRGIDPQYNGLILKFDFSCGNIHHGCLLLKSKGNYTFSTTVTSSPTKYVVVNVTGGTTTGPTTQSSASVGTEIQSNGQRTSKVETAPEAKREKEAKKTGFLIASVIISLAVGVVIVLVSLLLRWKRRRGYVSDVNPIHS